MSVDQVLNVDVIANSRSVGSWEVGTEYGERISPASRGVERTWYEVSFRPVVFADLTGRAGDVEIAQCGVGKAIRLRIGRDGAFGGKLRGSVWIDRLERRVFGNRDLLRSAVDRRSRREDDCRHSGV